MSNESRPGAHQGVVREVTAVSNPLVKELKSLALKKFREQTGLFIAEGLKLVTDALDGGWQVRTIAYARNHANERVLAAAARAHARGATVLETSEKVIGAITRRDNPQTVIAAIEQHYAEPAALLPKSGETGLWIGLDRVRDPGNLGTILRTADSVGARGVLLIGESTDSFSIEAVRATMGSVFHVPIARLDEAAFLKWRARWPGMVAGTHLEGSVDYRTPDFAGKAVLLLMGNEQQGLPPSLANACDVLCRIPMAGQADSLNLAIATGIMAYEIRRPDFPTGAA